MGCKYVDEFDFGPSKTYVKPYCRGGEVKKYATGGQAKVGKVMGEYKRGDLHSGSKTGPVVKNPKQALAIAMSEARAAKKK